MEISKLRNADGVTFHVGLGGYVLNKAATAEALGCGVDNLSKIRGKNGLNPLKIRINRKTVYALEDVESYMRRRL